MSKQLPVGSKPMKVYPLMVWAQLTRDVQETILHNGGPIKLQDGHTIGIVDEPCMYVEPPKPAEA